MNHFSMQSRWTTSPTLTLSTKSSSSSPIWTMRGLSPAPWMVRVMKFHCVYVHVHGRISVCMYMYMHVHSGLKPGQRKVLFTCFKRNDKREIKVAQLAGSVAEHSAYHHGEVYNHV